MQRSLNTIFYRLTAAFFALLAPMAIMISLNFNSQPAMAMVRYSVLPSTPFGTMSTKLDAIAKDNAGKLEAAYGELTGDKGHQFKGKGKQIQASAMNITEDIKDRAHSAAQKIADATD